MISISYSIYKPASVGEVWTGTCDQYIFCISVFQETNGNVLNINNLCL